ncbi:MAG: hypothetical protein ACFE7S_08975 [Candidatus Hodarchaeota archaeon]
MTEEEIRDLEEYREMLETELERVNVKIEKPKKKEEHVWGQAVLDAPCS